MVAVSLKKNFFQAEDGIRDLVRSRGLGDVYKRQIVLGGLLKLRPIVTLENVIKGLKKTLPERHHHLIPMNEEAIKKGMELIREV